MNGFIAGALLSLADRVTPAERREWAQAMRAEAAYLPDSTRLRWAFGCLVAALKLRFTPMQTGSLRINRWIMVVESLLCFGPSAAACWVLTFGQMGIVWLDVADLRRYFGEAPDTRWFIEVLYGYAVCSLVGPVGLFLGLRYALLRRGLRSRALGLGMIAAAIGWSLMGLASTFWIGKGDFWERLPLVVEFTILPVACTLHLMYVARPAAPTPGDARLAAG